MNEPLFGSNCYCHERPSLIVKSRAGGFVTQNCVVTGRPRALPFEELPNIQCARCDTLMTPFKTRYGNYAYKCQCCRSCIRLHDKIPHWSERFAHYGYAIDSDNEVFTPSSQTPSIEIPKPFVKVKKKNKR